MFEEDKKEWHKLFDYYKQHFGEEVGVTCGVMDTDDFEMDLFAGEDSSKVYGLRLYQVMELEEKDKAEALKKEKTAEKKSDEEGEEEDEEEEDEDEEEVSEVMAYDLILTPKAKIQGKVACAVTVDLTEEAKEGEAEEVRKLNLKIYTEDGDVNAYVTGVVGSYEGKPGSRMVFLEPPELK